MKAKTGKKQASFSLSRLALRVTGLCLAPDAELLAAGSRGEQVGPSNGRGSKFSATRNWTADFGPSTWVTISQTLPGFVVVFVSIHQGNPV